MTQTPPNSPRPIIVNAQPGREQLEAFGRQLLIGVSGFALGVWVTKDTHIIPDLVAFTHPLIGALSGAAGVGSIIFGQLKTRLASQISARLANLLPDDVAKTKAAPIIPLPVAANAPEPTPAPSPPAPRPVVQIYAPTNITKLRRPVSAFLIPYLERVEGEKTLAYQDSRGRWTIGVGHTGSDVGPGVVWTQPMIDAALQADLATAVTRLEAAIGREAIWSLTQAEYAALLSFVFNVGEVSTWAVWADIRERNLAAVPAELERFVYSDGVKVEGLVNRRAEDVALWNGTAPEVKLAA